jgi:hypothetical protein
MRGGSGQYWDGAMTEPSLEDLSRTLSEGRARLFQTIAGVTEQQFKQRPEASSDNPQPWCIAEVLSHLLDAERRAAAAIALAIEEDGARYTRWAEHERLERARAGRLAPVPQLIHGLLASRREIERLLARVDATPGGIARFVSDTQRGRLTVATVLQADVIAHEAEHIAQIEALRRFVGARELG